MVVLVFNVNDKIKYEICIQFENELDSVLFGGKLLKEHLLIIMYFNIRH